MSAINEKRPQEGTGRAASGESLTEPSGSVSPSYSGGGNRHSSAVPREISGTTTKKGKVGGDMPPPTVRDSVPAVPRTRSRCRVAALARSDSVSSVFSAGTGTDMDVESRAGSGSEASRPQSRCSSAARREREEGGDSPASLTYKFGVAPNAAKRRKTSHHALPTPGELVGLREAEVELAAAQKVAAREERLAAEEARVAEWARRIRDVSVSSGSRAASRVSAELAVEELPMEQLNERLRLAATSVRSVAGLSKGLKGTSQKQLKEAVSVILDVGEALSNRTSSGEEAKLRAANKRLADEVTFLKRGQEELRAETQKLREELLKVSVAAALPSAAPVLPPPPATAVDERLERVLKEVAGLSARFSALEGRVLRPPLAADARRALTAPAAPAATFAAVAAEQGSGAWPPLAPGTHRAVAGRARPSQAAETKKGGKKKGPAIVAKAPLPPKPVSAARAAARAREGEWQVAGAKEAEGRKRRKRNRGRRRREKQVAKAATQLRAPRSTAVVMTMQPGAEERGITYAALLSKAKASISLGELGISGLRCKPTLTGARLLEVPGAASAEAADALAAKLRASLDEADVRVTRPVRCVDLRVMGLDDSVSVEELVGAVAKAGDCPPETVRSGPIRPGLNQMGTAVVTCPVTAARNIVKGEKRLLVGWVSAQVKLLEPRTLRCHRCLVEGHVAARCTAQVNCAGRCYHCGQEGHIARSCTSTAHCIICAAAGRPAEHRAGSKACAAPKNSKGKAAGPPDVEVPLEAAPPDATSEPVGEVVMEVH